MEYTKRSKLLGIMVCFLIIGAFCAGIAYADSWTPPDVTLDDLGNVYDFVIKHDLTYTWATASNGSICYRSTNQSYVWQSAIDNGNSVYVTDGNYTFTTKVSITASNKRVVGGTNVWVLSSLTPCFGVEGGALNGSTGQIKSLNNTQIKNIRFHYTGAAGSGDGRFINITGVQNDFDLVGEVSLENVRVTSATARTVSSNLSYIGVYMDEFCGVTFRECSIAGFGVGLRLSGTSAAGECDELNLYGLDFSYCYIAVYITGTVNRVNMYNPKFLFCSNNGINSAVQMRLALFNAQFESCSSASGIAIEMTVGNLLMSGGYFSACKIGLQFGSTSYDYANAAVLTNVRFSGCTTAGLKSQGHVCLLGCYFTNTNTANVTTAGSYSSILGFGMETSNDFS